MRKKAAQVLMLSTMVGLLTGCAGTPVVYYTECNCTQEIHNQQTGAQTQESQESSSADEAPILAEGAL